MATDYTFNELSNEDKELLMAHGYRPGELNPEEARDVLTDLRDQIGGDEDSERLSGADE